MESIILTYYIKVSISLLLFGGLYILLLREDTFLRMRRLYFWLALCFSVLFPFISINLAQEQSIPAIPAYWLSQIEVTSDETIEATTTHVSAMTILAIATVIVTALLLCKMGLQIASILKIRRKNEVVKSDGYTIIKMQSNTSPFSFFKWIFINKEDEYHCNIEEIITHEKAHARQLHSLDVIVTELMCCIFWWNPIIWMFRHEVKINLEYLADNEVLRTGHNLKQYQYALLLASSNNTQIQIINNFNVSQLKKRIMMMNRTKTPLGKVSKYLLAAPLCAFLVLGNTTLQASTDILGIGTEKDTIPEKLQISVADVPTNSKASNDEQAPALRKDKPFTVVDEMPRYPGGENAMINYISTNLKYPKEAQNACLQGRVTVRFVVEKDGSITDVKVIRGLYPACDAEAIRVVKEMPKWTPGKQKGVAVPVFFTLPIVFRLTKDGGDTKITDYKDCLFIIDGKVHESLPSELEDADKIESVLILKGDKMEIENYGKLGKDKKGIIKITTKK